MTVAPPAVARSAAHAPTRATVARTPRWWRDLSTAAAGAGLLFVVVLWLQGGGLATLGAGLAGSTTSIGRLTGLVASDLLLLQVLLMARVPFVERSFGQDELARLHRLVGFWSFNLMVAHVAFITVGYALTDRRNPLAELWTLVWTYPGMIMATVGTGLLVMVVVTSIRAARRRLRYESWHLLHLYAYLGVGLALPHQLWTGNDFLTSRGATVFWWGAYLVTAGAVLTFRLGVPAYRTLRHRPVVRRVVRESTDVVSVYVGGRDLHRLPVRAGQFFIWRFLDRAGWTRGNPYSVSAAPGGELRITVKDLGAGSARLAELQPGTRVLLEGPYGRLSADVRTRRTVTMLGAGIGITPLRALLEDLPYAPGEASLIYRAHSTDDLLLRQEIDELARTRGVDVFYVTGPRRTDRPSWLPESAGGTSDARMLQQLVPRIAGSDVYVCGPDAWLDAAVSATRAAGVPAAQVHVERFAW
ncbi:MAG: oxidoreductase [Frankiales bacterium]|nr:oxidoreductase [Frankiales bacterium]